jgi:hypothetical protein
LPVRAGWADAKSARHCTGEIALKRQDLAARAIERR